MIKKSLHLKIFSIFMILIVFCSNFAIVANASDNDFYAQYSGSTTAGWGYKPDCIFTINKIVGNRFRGNFSAQNIDKYSFSENVSGFVTKGSDSFTCYFRVNFYNNKYYSNITATVYPYEGRCECLCDGSWHLVDFEMTGTKFNFNIDPSKIIDSSEYNENNMILCMKLSNYIYGYKEIKTNKNGKEKEKKVLISYDNSFKNIINSRDKEFYKSSKISRDSLKVYNFKHLGINDHNADNVAFAIMLRENDDDSADVFVVIRGTYKDEWQGNTEITGTEYDEACKVHENFQMASDSIKATIKKYVQQNCLNYDNVNLIITGHSRGAAVANLYAKEATDSINGVYNASIPTFSSVTAYTFATPNVAKYDNSMENYNNIYNFCFKEDVVPTVPLTKPVSGWGYWKYGKTFLASLNDIKSEANLLTDDFYIVNNAYKIHDCLWNWTSVDDYYNKKLYSDDSTKDYTTLYDFAHSATGFFGSFSKKTSGAYNLLKNYKKYGDIYPIIGTALPILTSIGNAHHYDTYLNVISKTGDDYFKLTTFNDIATSVYSNEDNQAIGVKQIQNISASNEDVSKLISFANQEDNLSILGWDLDDPSTWTGITWNEDGNAESIDLSFKNLSGSLDLSNFNSLKQLDVTGNNLTSLNLDNCSSLEEIDCSFNKLTVLDLSDCTNLTSVTCCYNYLDTHDGGTLYNTLDDLMFSDCYVNYYPQSVPDNAVFNTTELNALKTFAKANGNNSALDWLDSKGNIDTEKLQNNVLFEYDGSKYRIAAIDISDLDVSGSLNVTSLTKLKELYCKNTKLTTLNVKGCTKLETLKCDGSRLTTLTLPSNAGAKTSTLYDVSCEYNYLDTTIFTENVVKYVEFKAGGKIEFENQKGDSSALQAALYFANKLDEKDYSAESFEPLKELIDECNCYNYDNLYLNQDEIDEITTDILTAMYDLKAYFNISVSVENGTLSMAYNDTTVNGNAKRSILYGTTVTLNAIADSGYSFVGWYDEINNRYLSYESQYIFKADSNLKLKAIIVPEGSATLTFANYSNWVAGTVTKTTAQWAEIGSISDLLLDVPYRYGYSNGKWVYDEQEILTKLRSGENVLITAEYTAGDTTMPTPRESTDTPLLDLYYKYDNDNKVGSFVMAAGFPENIHIESVGVAFYYKNADEFDPTDNFILLMNNKMLVSRFNTDTLEDIYIVNINKMSSKYNWAARGYVTYYDETGKLVTAYSNQINIIDTKNADEMNTLLENDGQSVNNKPKPNIEYGTGEDD